MLRTGGANGPNDSHADTLLSYPIIHLSNLIITTFLSISFWSIMQAEPGSPHNHTPSLFPSPVYKGAPTITINYCKVAAVSVYQRSSPVSGNNSPGPGLL